MKRVSREDWKKARRTGMHFRGTPAVPVVRDLMNVDSKKQTMKIGFQVADVAKPLMSVKRVTSKGNRVCFGPEDKDNYIQNVKSGMKIPMRQSGRGSYLLDLQFVGGAKTELTGDSGAEENVCPKAWGGEFGIRGPDQWMKFRGANGKEIKHYGHRDVRVESPFYRQDRERETRSP